MNFEMFKLTSLERKKDLKALKDLQSKYPG
jgi:hypothetical protein